MRAYGNPQDEAPTRFALLENAKKALDEAGIEIPFPQRVITMIK
jgi:small-conductance mechanosensitive channel